MRYLSLFSGIEAATVAWEPLGWEPAAFCEKDEFPSAVLAHRWPDVPNLGDITKVDWSEYADGTVDLVVGGSPCQSFSVAGNREGLAGESRLMWEYIRCVREVRPRWCVWENVPGALSSGPDKGSRGEDFGCLLRALDELGYGLAWRVLDAQFFGVAQRRRRVFLVGSLGNQRASEILFEPDCLRWDRPSSREKRQELTRAAQYGSSESRGGCLTPWDYQTIRIYSEDGPFATLMNNDGNGNTGLNRQSVLTKTYCPQGSTIGREDKNGPQGEATDVMDTLVAQGPHAVCMATQQGGAEICFDLCPTITAAAGMSGNNQPVVCMASGQANAEVEYDMAPAQAARQYKDPQIVCFNAGNANDVAHIGESQSEVAPCLRASRSGTNGTPVVCMTQYGSQIAGTLMAKGDSSPCHDRGENVVTDGYVVRRLTPRECERLQGFPDDHTMIPYRGKPAEECPDTPRYKALGNSMAVPVMRWIGERIEMVDGK